MSKIILHEAPCSSQDCPFCSYDNKCKLSGDRECNCIGGYRDSLTFDFSKCDRCTAPNNEEVEEEANYIYYVIKEHKTGGTWAQCGSCGSFKSKKGAIDYCIELMKENDLSVNRFTVYCV